MTTSRISPIGTAAFTIPYAKLTEDHVSKIIIHQASFGAHVVLIVRENQTELSYYHWSPGTAGRVAKIDVRAIPQAPTIQIVFNWHPKKIQLLVTPVNAPHEKAAFAEGHPTNKTFRKSRLNKIIQVGDEGVELLEIRMEIGGKPIILPTAYESWRSTKQACDTLQRGTSEDGYLFEVVKNNSVVTQLVTGFETYCKTRLVEMEQEGLEPNLPALSKLLSLKTENKKTLIEEAKKEATQAEISVLELWIIRQRRINFQEFDKAKKAFNKAYEIKFGEIGINGDDIDKLRTLFAHRHRVIHVSPIATLMPNHNPAIGKQLSTEAPNRFERFIEALHESTLTRGLPDVQPE